ncbi:MAG: hypothetical protein ABIH23_05685 [bacterium]
MKNLIIWLAICIFLLALLPRLLVAFAPHPALFSDMEDYDRTAVNFLRGHGLVMSPEYRAYRPPGYPLFLVFLYTLAGRNFLVVRIVQAVLSGGSCVLLFVLARSLLAEDRRRWVQIGVPVVAGAALALSKTHALFSGILLTETLFTFLLLVFAVILCGASPCGRMFRFAAPVLLGVLSLIRPIAALYLPALLVADACVATGDSDTPGWTIVLKRSVLKVSLFLLPLVPWTIRNAVVLHAFVPLSTNAGVNFYIGHHPGYSYWSTGAKETIRSQTDLDEVAENRLFFRIGLDYILHHPGQTVADTVRKAVYLLRPGITPWPANEPVYNLKFPLIPGIRTILVQWNWIFLILFPIGAVLAWRSLPRSRPIHVLVVCHIAATLCYFARSRFRLPLEPFFLLWIAFAIMHGAGTAVRLMRKEAK